MRVEMPWNFTFSSGSCKEIFFNKSSVPIHDKTLLLHAYVQDSYIDKKDYFRRSKDTLSVVLLHELALVPCRRLQMI